VLHIVSTIKPIQLIVSAIAGKDAKLEQIIPDFADPHDYHFKPSDIRKINNADVIFRIDEHMEVMLNSAFENSNTPLISLADVEGISLLDLDDQTPTGHSHGHENSDMHIWTSPQNALMMANAVTKALKELHPAKTIFYELNLQKFKENIDNKSNTITEQLKPLQNKPYVVFHNSWQYFANEFGLLKPLVVNTHESVNSGVKTLSKIRSQIKEQNITCVFSDSTISSQKTQQILGVADSNIREIDILSKGQNQYIDWLTHFSSQVHNCLMQ